MAHPTRPTKLTKSQRLAKWFTTLSPKEKAKIIKDVSQLVLSRRTRMCNFLEYKGNCSDTKLKNSTDLWVADSKVVYRRYASLFFIAGCASTDNELVTLEIVHRYVEQMDKYYGNVCELDIIFNFQKAYFILDELLLAGEMQESSKKNVLRCISQQDSLEDMEVSSSSFAVTALSNFTPSLLSARLLSFGESIMTDKTLPFRWKMMASRRSCDQEHFSSYIPIIMHTLLPKTRPIHGSMTGCTIIWLTLSLEYRYLNTLLNH